jgi:hypothetical protein
MCSTDLFKDKIKNRLQKIKKSRQSKKQKESPKNSKIIPKIYKKILINEKNSKFRPIFVSFERYSLIFWGKTQGPLLCNLGEFFLIYGTFL